MAYFKFLPQATNRKKKIIYDWSFFFFLGESFNLLHLFLMIAYVWPTLISLLNIHYWPIVLGLKLNCYYCTFSSNEVILMAKHG